MSEPDRQTCPECGKPFPESGSHQVCPACLMAQAMASRTRPDEAGDRWAGQPTPTPEEIADKFPQFEVTECLGRGGMGVVYKARQKSLARWVAIKILAPGREREPDFATRFAREAQTLARMNHPNIVTVYDHGETDGMFYIVMEFVDGVNLRDLLREGKMEPEQALAIVPPICEALQYAHGKGVIHRDIKPENLLLDREGRVKIADFGVAKLVCGPEGPVDRGAESAGSASQLTMQGKLGTPQYMAPEQEEKSAAADHRSDIYALGVVLYEMLTGERPADELVAPSRKVEVDVRIDEIVLRALEKEPAKRYQTAEEFRTIVQTIARPAATPDAGGRAPAPRPGKLATKRYNPWEEAIVGMGTLFFVIMLVVVLEASSHFRLSLIMISVLGLAICLVSAVGLWPGPSPIFPEPNFSSRNLRRNRGAASSQPGTKPRLSRIALWGAICLIPLFAIVTLLVPALTAIFVWRGYSAAPPEVSSPDSGGGISVNLRDRSQGLSEADRLGLHGPGIRWIDLQDSLVTDEDLKLVAKHPELEWLNLTCTLHSDQPQITDDMLKRLAGCRGLKSLQLHGNPITDAGLEHFASLPNLESIQLGGTEVTGAGLAHLPNLKWLRLDASPVNDAGLEHVGRMGALEQLYLDITGITDAGLLHLHGLRKLRVLNLHDTKVTAEGVAALKRAIPSLSVGVDAHVAAGLARPGEFGEIVERTLEGNDSLRNCFMDVESGHVLSAPDELVESLRRKGQLFGGGPQVMTISNWARVNGVDFWLRKGDGNRLIVLEGFCIQTTKEFGALEASDVHSLSEDLTKVMRSHAERGFHMACNFGPENPEGNTWIFRTREGASGALQVDHDTEVPGNAKLRIKVVTPEP